MPAFFMKGRCIEKEPFGEICQRRISQRQVTEILYYPLTLSQSTFCHRALHPTTVNARTLLKNSCSNVSLGREVQLGIFATVTR